MQQNPDDPLISIAEAARRLGMNRSTLLRQTKNGDIRCHGGKVRFSEVLEDRAANIDLTRSKRRDGDVDDVASDAVDATNLDAMPADATIGDDVEPVIVDGVVLPYKEARALKETYMARLRRLEFQIKSGAYVEIEAVCQEVERDYGVVRQRLLTIPGKLALHLVGLDRAAIQIALRSEIHEALTELHKPAAI